MSFFMSIDEGSAIPHRIAPQTRREWLFRAGGGFGARVPLVLLAGGGGRAEAGEGAGADLSGPRWRRPATAKSVIFVFIEGGPSHIDLFDPKPALQQLAGKPLPPSFKPVITPMGEFHSPVLASRRKW